MTPRQRLQSYYGYAFESYCTSSRPGRRETDGWGGDVNTNVQWCSVVKTKLGDRRMVIGGEVDCVRGRYVSTLEGWLIYRRQVLWKYRQLCRTKDVPNYTKRIRRSQV